MIPSFTKAHTLGPDPQAICPHTFLQQVRSPHTLHATKWLGFGSGRKASRAAHSGRMPNPQSHSCWHHRSGMRAVALYFEKCFLEESWGQSCRNSPASPAGPGSRGSPLAPGPGTPSFPSMPVNGLVTVKPSFLPQAPSSDPSSTHPEAALSQDRRCFSSPGGQAHRSLLPTVLRAETSTSGQSSACSGTDPHMLPPTQPCSPATCPGRPPAPHTRWGS